jgi:hypothetical protein
MNHPDELVNNSRLLDFALKDHLENAVDFGYQPTYAGPLTHFTIAKDEICPFHQARLQATMNHHHAAKTKRTATEERIGR